MIDEKKIEKRFCYRCGAKRDYEIVAGTDSVETRGSRHVVARESSHVEAWESSHVVARESSHVVAWGSSHVEAWESSHVVARESSHVVAWGSSHVVAWGSSHVVAWGSSHVEAWESSHVVARESSHVVARESSHVVAWGSSHVEGQSAMTAIIIRSGTVTGTGGRRVEMFTQPTDVHEWARTVNAVLIDETHVLLYKKTDSQFETRNFIKYVPGTRTEAPDWDTERECGGGLHLCPHPKQCDGFRSERGDRYVAVSVAVADIVIHAEPQYPDKVKVRACDNLYECNADGKRIETQSPVSCEERVK